MEDSFLSFHPGGRAWVASVSQSALRAAGCQSLGLSCFRSRAFNIPL